MINSHNTYTANEQSFPPLVTRALTFRIEEGTLSFELDAKEALPFIKYQMGSIYWKIHSTPYDMSKNGVPFSISQKSVVNLIDTTTLVPGEYIFMLYTSDYTEISHIFFNLTIYRISYKMASGDHDSVHRSPYRNYDNIHIERARKLKFNDIIDNGTTTESYLQISFITKVNMISLKVISFSYTIHKLSWKLFDLMIKAILVSLQYMNDMSVLRKLDSTLLHDYYGIWEEIGLNTTHYGNMNTSPSYHGNNTLHDYFIWNNASGYSLFEPVFLSFKSAIELITKVAPVYEC